jgi:ABC-2 type transport system ATP-binding protein
MLHNEETGQQASGGSDRGIAVSVRNAVKRFGEVTALAGVGFDLRKGELVALLGPNGSGKTTLVNALLGLLRLDEGEVQVFGHSAGSADARACLGAMQQAASPPDSLRVGELIDLYRGYYGAPLPLDQIVAMADLSKLVDRRYGMLSGGEKRRVQFALAIGGDARIIVLDEPTTHMDHASREVFWNTIHSLRQQGKTVLLVTHQMEEIDALADRVLVISNGKVLQDTTVADIRRSFALSKISCVTSLDQAFTAA